MTAAKSSSMFSYSGDVKYELVYISVESGQLVYIFKALLTLFTFLI